METVRKQIVISSDSIVIDIQKAFSSYYPFLKIEFYKKEKHLLSYKINKVNPGSLIFQIIEVRATVKVDVENNRTIAEIEKDFTDLLGLSIQVFRKSGNVWNVISLTDSWTLESQNNAGEFISTEMAAAS